MGVLIMLSINRRFQAFLDKMNEIAVIMPKEFDSENKTFFIKIDQNHEALSIVEKIDIGKQIKYVCSLSNPLSFGKTYIISDEDGLETDLQIGAVIRSDEFDKKFYYDGNDLGANYTKEKTEWKVWAPTATIVKLRIYRSDGTQVDNFHMIRCEKGTWSITLDGDFEGYYYTFLACINLVWNEAVDPYARAVSINGEYGIIIDQSLTNVPIIIPPALNQKTDTIIYEVHVRDFSIHENSGMKNKGQYDAWTELNTKNSQGDSTGISYLKELGVTHIELLPVNDFEEVDEQKPFEAYNWGYNPLHYFAPEGSYSAAPENPYKRIIELKTLIQSLHKQNLRVIIDVVFNHVYSKENSSFEKLLPGYYFRHDENGMPSNGTGVGNDLASERLMVKKFIADCVKYWMNEFDIDGFRFDLMGILDVKTMNEVQKEVLQIKEDAILLGEGWDLLTPLPYVEKAIIPNAHKLPTISFFNDQFRDVIKGSTFSVHDRGFVYENLDTLEQMKALITGSPTMFHEPHQSINYVESHDNHTMWDRFLTFADAESEEIRKARHRLATSIVLLSQGIPFLHGGQEFFRTKNGVENSYNSPDEINHLNWDERSKQKENVEYIKGLIKLRKLHGGFRLSSQELINKHVYFNDYPHLLSYEIENVGAYGPWERLVVIHHPHCNKSYQFKLPGNKGWKQIVSPSSILLDQPIDVDNKIEIREIGTYVFCKN